MWARVINILIGLWLIASPAVLQMDKIAANNLRVIGPLVVSFAFIAIWEVTRTLRWVNVALGAWLPLGSWVLGYASLVPTLNESLCGVIIIVLGLVKGKLTRDFGSGWAQLWRGDLAPKQHEKL
jgi:hypothetical protein